MATKKKTQQPEVLPPEQPAAEQPVDLVGGLQKANWYVKLITGYDIPDAVELAAAKDLVKEVHGQIKLWEKAREEDTRALKDEYDARRKLYNPVLVRLENAKKALTGAIGRFELTLLQQQRAMRELAAKAAPSEYIQGMREARAAGPEAVKGVTVATDFKAVLVDAEAVPETYRKWYIDMEQVQAAVDAGARDIPGIDVVETPRVTVRSR